MGKVLLGMLLGIGIMFYNMDKLKSRYESKLDNKDRELLLSDSLLTVVQASNREYIDIALGN